MPTLRTLPQPVGQLHQRRLLSQPGDEATLDAVARLATQYPFPHSILGTDRAGGYVRQLAARGRCSGEGWYGIALDGGEVAAAAHLGLYGTGGGDGHSLWKIRHPLLAARAPGECLSSLFRILPRAALQARPGSAKVVAFLGEFEAAAIRCVREAGFQQEACFADYYRLGEHCLVFGRTIGGRP
jgi:hypothetical protein